jgi:hypothetical protein
LSIMQATMSFLSFSWKNVAGLINCGLTAFILLIQIKSSLIDLPVYEMLKIGRSCFISKYKEHMVVTRWLSKG